MLADITRISEATGSLEGGHLLTVRGNGFTDDKAKISIDINGNACAVESASLHEIKCRTAKKGGSSTFPGPVYPGGSGLRRWIWGGVEGNGVSGIPDLKVEDAHVIDILPTGETSVLRGTNYKQSIKGLFKAPRTGDYRFFLTSDDHSKVWLSTDDTEANKQELISFASNTAYRHHMLFYESTRSAVKTLTAGKYYYIEIHHA